MHGVNPPLELDKRKQCKLLKKGIKTINSNALGGDDELRAITYSQRAAEILENDYLVHISQTSPDRIQYRNDAADSLRMAAITACEKGVMQ